MSSQNITTRNSSNVYDDVQDLIATFDDDSVAESFSDLPLDYRGFVADTACALHRFKIFFDSVDRTLQGKSIMIRKSIQQLVLRKQVDEFYKFLDSVVDQLSVFARSPEKQKMSHYLRRALWSSLIESPIHFQTIAKPRGYAGDFTTMELIYDNRFEGNTSFGKFLHKYSMSTPAANCGRDRRRLITELIQKAYNAHKRKDTFRVASIACGSAAELMDFLSANEDPELKLLLLDHDAEALEEARRRILTATDGWPRSPVTSFCQESVFSILKARDPAEKFGTYDFIYSVGLFDYLEDKITRAMLAKLTAMLSPGGSLVIGNLRPSNPDKVYMEFLMNWNLIYRDKNDYDLLSKDLDGKFRVETYLDKTEIQLYYVLVKE